MHIISCETRRKATEVYVPVNGAYLQVHLPSGYRQDTHLQIEVNGIVGIGETLWNH